jgi:hypothetical protein
MRRRIFKPEACLFALVALLLSCDELQSVRTDSTGEPSAPANTDQAPPTGSSAAQTESVTDTAPQERAPSAAELVKTPPASDLEQYEYPDPFVRAPNGFYVTITLNELRDRYEGDWPPSEQREGETSVRDLRHFIWRVPEYRSQLGWEIRWVDEYGIPPEALATRDETKHPDGVTFDAKNRHDERVCLQFSLKPRMPKGHKGYSFAPPQYIFEPGEVRTVELRHPGWRERAELSEGKLLVVTPRYECSGSHIIDRNGERVPNPYRDE